MAPKISLKAKPAAAARKSKAAAPKAGAACKAASTARPSAQRAAAPAASIPVRSRSPPRSDSGASDSGAADSGAADYGDRMIKAAELEDREFLNKCLDQFHAGVASAREHLKTATDAWTSACELEDDRRVRAAVERAAQTCVTDAQKAEVGAKGGRLLDALRAVRTDLPARTAAAVCADRNAAAGSAAALA